MIAPFFCAKNCPLRNTIYIDTSKGDFCMAGVGKPADSHAGGKGEIEALELEFNQIKEKISKILLN